jgi:proteic killer suppression protein
MIVRTQVLLSKFAEKQLGRVPVNIREALLYWAKSVERLGVREVRRYSGYHDEPLKGDRRGQRSIRLNRSYRAIYVENIEDVEILVIEVNKHDY